MLIEAKSNLARLMATENLVVEERNVETAYFDVKSRILTVPILNGNLSADLYDLLLGHEVGHALETPIDGWHDSVKDHSVNKSILNVCEDVRIEKKIKRKFPGLKYSFIRGYQELMNMDFFGTKDTDLNTLNFIDRVNLYTKGGATQGIIFNEEETKLLHEIESTETWTDVVLIARKVQDFMKAELEELSKQKVEVKVQIVSGDGDSDEEAESDGEQITIEISSEDLKGSVSSDGEEEKDDEAAKENDKQAAGNKDASKDKAEELASQTDESFRKREKELYKNEDKKDIIYSTIPDVILENIIFDYKEVLQKIEIENDEVRVKTRYSYPKLNHEALNKNFVKFKNESTKIVSYLVKEFELRKNAEQQKKASISKTGELNMNRVYEYKLTDDIFKRLSNVPNGKSHGLVMFIDWSGSMADHLPATIRQLLNLVMFCKKVNIPFEVYAFTTQWYKAENNYGGYKKKQNPVIGDLALNSNFSLMNLFSNRMSAKDFMSMAKYLLDIGSAYKAFTNNYHIPEELCLGGTPLNSSIVTAFKIIPKFQQDNKLQIVNSVFLTDGESSNVEGRWSFINSRNNQHTSNNENTPNWKRRSLLRDPVTKAVEEIHLRNSYSGSAMMETVALLKLLKQRCECNVIGFFIGTTRQMSDTFNSYAKDESQVSIWKEQFRTKGYVVVTSSGYDEYYLLRSTAMELDEADLDVKTNTTRGFVSAFSKYTGNKVSSRIILNRFIGLIT